MKHRTKHNFDKKKEQREELGSWSTRKSRALDRQERKNFERIKRNKEIDIE